MLDFDPSVDAGRPDRADESDLNFRPVAKTFRVRVNKFFKFHQQSCSTVSESKIRWRILTRVANSAWGLGAGVLKMTLDFIITSLI